MQSWRERFLGIDTIPGWLSDFEIDQFFSLTPGELATVKTRRTPELQLGLALHIGFLRMSGRVLNGTDAIPRRLLEYLGKQLEIRPPRVTSLRALYPRKQTLHEHQHLAVEQLRFGPFIERVERHLVAYLKQTRGAATAPDELVANARQWIHEHRYLMPSERQLLDCARAVLSDEEQQLAQTLRKRVTATRRKSWTAALAQPHPAINGISRLDWLKQSPRTRRGQGLSAAFERIHFLQDLGADRIDLPAMPVALVKSYAARVSRLKLTRFNRLRAVTRDIGLACFLQLTLWRTCDEAIEAWLMRVAEVRRLALSRSATTADAQWQQRYLGLLSRVQGIADADEATAHKRLVALIAGEREILGQTRAEQARLALLEMHAQVRSLLRLFVALPIQFRESGDWLAVAVPLLQDAYARQRTSLPESVSLEFLPRFWRRALSPASEKRRFHVLEAATVLQLQRALRSGSAFVPTSLLFRERETLMIPRETWESRRNTHLRQLSPSHALSDAVGTIVPAVEKGLQELVSAVRLGKVLIARDGIRLDAIDPPVELVPDAEERVRRAFAEHVGPVELPGLMMEIDSQVRFSTTLLRRPPKNTMELKAIYGAVLAHGIGLDRTQVLRMIPEVADAQVRLAMALIEEEDRLAEANHAVVQFMRRHPIVGLWGETGLASSDMMSVEASRRLWNARIDPRTGSYAIGTYTHVLDQWGIAYDQPIILNRRQAGAAIEGVLMQRLMPISRLAVDTHGYTDVAMGLARLLGFDLCPRLAMLRERKLYVPSRLYVPKALRPVTVEIPLRTLRAQWDELLRLAASIREGWCSATQALGRFGSDAQGDPLYQAAATFGRLVRTQYLCRYFADSEFRGAIRRVLNHGESVHQLQRTIHPFAIGPKRARSRDEQRAISGSLALLSNLVMAWNTHKLQAIADLPAYRKASIALADIAAVGPVATSHINFRGVLHFPLDQYSEPILRPPIRLSSA